MIYFVPPGPFGDLCFLVPISSVPGAHLQPPPSWVNGKGPLKEAGKALPSPFSTSVPYVPLKCHSHTECCSLDLLVLPHSRISSGEPGVTALPNMTSIFMQYLKDLKPITITASVYKSRLYWLTNNPQTAGVYNHQGWLPPLLPVWCESIAGGQGILLSSVTLSVKLGLAQTGIGPANGAEERVWQHAERLAGLLSGGTHTTCLLVSLAKPANKPKLGLNGALKFNHPPERSSGYCRTILQASSITQRVVHQDKMPKCMVGNEETSGYGGYLRAHTCQVSLWCLGLPWERLLLIGPQG